MNMKTGHSMRDKNPSLLGIVANAQEIPRVESEEEKCLILEKDEYSAMKRHLCTSES